MVVTAAQAAIQRRQPELAAGPGVASSLQQHQHQQQQQNPHLQRHHLLPPNTDTASPASPASPANSFTIRESKFGFDDEVFLESPAMGLEERAKKEAAGMFDSGGAMVSENASLGSDSRSATPRMRRLQRLNSITSKMDVIEASMNSEDWERLMTLAAQGAVHYQAEEDFLNAPPFTRTRSAPTTSLAERYERLRSCTVPDFLRGGEASALGSISGGVGGGSLTGPPSASNSRVTLDMMEGLPSLAMLTSTGPLREIESIPEHTGRKSSPNGGTSANSNSNSSTATVPTSTSAPSGSTPPKGSSPQPASVLVDPLLSAKAATLPAVKRQSATLAMVAALPPSPRGSAGICSVAAAAAEADMYNTVRDTNMASSDDAVVPSSSVAAPSSRSSASSSSPPTARAMGLSSSMPATPVFGRAHLGGAAGDAVPPPEGSRLSKKRGSDPTLEDIKLMKKKKGRQPFFRRDRGGDAERVQGEDSTDASSSTAHDGHRSWRQRMRDYVRSLWRKR